jgi:hypothetical protein
MMARKRKGTKKLPFGGKKAAPFKKGGGRVALKGAKAPAGFKTGVKTSKKFS